MIAIIDKSDWPSVRRFAWIVKRCGSPENPLWYAHRRIQKSERSYYAGSTISMHRFLLGSNSEIDHKNGDGLDNRRVNLRIATKSQNQGNAKLRTDSSTKIKGVAYRKQSGNRRPRWCARIGLAGKRIHLGSFQTPSEAAAAYNAAAFRQWKEFARTNKLT